MTGSGDGLSDGEGWEDEVEAETGRGKGFLTARDKTWLVEGPPDDAKANTIRQYRRTIRRRLKDAIQDFRLIAQYVGEGDIEQVFEGVEGFEEELLEAETVDEIDYEKWALYHGSHGALKTLYKGLGRELFQILAERAVSDVEGGEWKAETEEGVRVLGPLVDVEIQVPEMVRLDELVKKFDAEETVALTDAEMGAVVKLMQEGGGEMPTSGDDIIRLHARTHGIDDLDAAAIEKHREEAHRVGYPVQMSLDTDEE